MEYLHINTENSGGEILLGLNVVEAIVRKVVNETADVYPAKKDNEYVTCKVMGDNLSISIALRLRLGCNLNKVFGHLQNQIHDDLLAMTGVDCRDIMLDVVAFVSEKEK